MPTVLRIDCYNKEFEIEQSKESGPLTFAIKKHLENKTYKYRWVDDRNIVCIGRGPLAGTNVSKAADAVITVKEPSTKHIGITHLKDFGAAIQRANLDHVVFEKKSDEPLVIGINWDDELNVKFTKIREKQFHTIATKGTRNVNKKLGLFLKGFFKNSPHQIASCGLGAYTGYGSIVSQNATGNAAAGSVLKQAHNIVTLGFGGHEIADSFDELTLNQVYYYNEKLLQNHFPDMEDRKEELLFNNAFITPPKNILNHTKGIDSFGLSCGLLNQRINDKIKNEIMQAGLDSKTMMNLLSGTMKSYNDESIPREELKIKANTTFNYEEYKTNTNYYASEHARVYSKILRMITKREDMGVLFALPYSEMISEIQRFFGKDATKHFLKETKISFKELYNAQTGVSENSNLPRKVFGELAGMKTLRKIDYIDEAINAKRMMEKYNSLSR